ncbi:cytochrome P450-dit2 [Serendipita sp. 399]|nr:cytochrome P450-dit2 [Serendipita sp. 399]
MFELLTSASPLTLALWSIPIGALTALAVWLRNLYKDPFPLIDGPPTKNLIFGHFPEILREEVGIVYQRWHEKYGPVYKVRGFMGSTRLVINDAVAARHIMVTRGYSYGKHEGVRVVFRWIEGSVYGDDHKKVRKMMLHTFTPGHLRTLHPTIREYADQYVQVLSEEREIAENNMLKYMKHVALDIIGAASYGYATGVLRKQDTPLAVALETIVSQVSNDTIRVPLPTALRAYFPRLEWYLLADTRLFDRNVKHLRKVAYEVLYMRKEALGVLTAEDREHIKKAGLRIDRERVGNFAMGIDDDAAMLDPDDPDKLDDEWILAQIMVLFWAGHESTATSMTWLIYELSRNPDVQSRVRSELLAAGLDCDVRTLLDLPYLNGVVHESLRLHSTSGQSIRHAFADDVIPLSKPVNGMYAIPIREESYTFDFAGQEICFNHPSMNCREDIWGEDSWQFKPERWINLPEAAREDTMPGWEGVANFGSGNRQCVGAGFAVMEIKEVLLRLLTHFEFALPDDPDEREIEGWNRMLTKPFVKKEGKHAMPRLPVKIIPLRAPSTA